MNSEYINILLERYWNCETTLEEEKELQDFFSGVGVPEDLEQYIPLFSYIRMEQSVTLSKNFDNKLKAALEDTDKNRYVTIRIYTPLLRIAASVLLLVGLGTGLFFITRQNNKPHFTEKFEDPNAVMQQATYALEKLSNALQMSEAASMQTIRDIDDLNIDWSSIDSLSNLLDDNMDDSLNSTVEVKKDGLNKIGNL
ncbi:MAG: hypothetical protein PHI70_00800 [Proteiniphilum sp.]|nr:hypothetical protein [Proteiniphilum sp.]MDD3908575.1 hypothetical protein [Proteiniphilum sp.]MDD4415317.1 hypothetical protein [Proteiniphilum sp.]